MNNERIEACMYGPPPVWDKKKKLKFDPLDTDGRQPDGKKASRLRRFRDWLLGK